MAQFHTLEVLDVEKTTRDAIVACVENRLSAALLKLPRSAVAMKLLTNLRFMVAPIKNTCKATVSLFSFQINPIWAQRIIFGRGHGNSSFRTHTPIGVTYPYKE